jgi:hypothetical protein
VAVQDTPRRLLALIQGLPPDAATWREDTPNWSQQDELVASLIETTAAWGNQMVSALIAVHGGKPQSIEPVRIEHPDRPMPEKPKPKKRRLATPADVAAQLG